MDTVPAINPRTSYNPVQHSRLSKILRKTDNNYMESKNTKQLKFRGYIDLPDSNHCKMICTIEYQLHDSTTLDIELFLLEEETSNIAGRYLSRLPCNYIWLHSDESRVPSVEVLGISSISVYGSRVAIYASEIQVGVTQNILEKDTNWYIKAELTPSGILVKPGIREMSYTGDMSFKSIVEGTIECSTLLGAFEVGERYDHYSSDEYEKKRDYSIFAGFWYGLREVCRVEFWSQDEN